jgi:hypothetical protein
MKKILLAFAMYTSLVSLNAQDIHNARLAWSVTTLSDLNTKKSSSYNCVFETNGQQEIKWKQNGGTDVTLISVSKLTGAWANISTTGEVVFNISVEGETGTLTFTRNGSNTFIVLDLPISGANRIKHKYSVSKVMVIS